MLPDSLQLNLYRWYELKFHLPLYIYIYARAQEQRHTYTFLTRHLLLSSDSIECEENYLCVTDISTVSVNEVLKAKGVTCRHTKKFCTLSTQYIYLFHVILTIRMVISKNTTD